MSAKKSKFEGIANLRQAPDSPPPKAARPKGKRSDPAFEQVTAYVRSETYRRVKIKLLEENQNQDFSDLVEALLNEYLRR